MRSRIVVCSLSILIVLLWVSPAFAKGPPQKLAISGPGLPAVEATDQPLLNRLAIAQLEDFFKGPINPPSVGAGYEITRYYRNETMFTPFDTLHYYPGANGGPGYIFYDGLTPFGGWSEYDGRWYRTQPDGEAALQQIIATYTADRRAYLRLETLRLHGRLPLQSARS